MGARGVEMRRQQGTTGARGGEQACGDTTRGAEARWGFEGVAETGETGGFAVVSQGSGVARRRRGRMGETTRRRLNRRIEQSRAERRAGRRRAALALTGTGAKDVSLGWDAKGRDAMARARQGRL